MNRRLLAIPLLVVPAALFAAQAERLTIRMVPAPNQTLHVQSTMDMTMTMTAEPTADGGLQMPPVTSSMTTTAEHTTTVGPTDHDGHYNAKVVCDRVTHSALLNGEPAPVPAGATDQLVGLAVTFSYDDQGKVLNVASEGTMDPGIAGSMKQILTTALAAAPPITLSVGESVTVPAQVNVPLPASISGTMTTSGETRYTLTSITFDGADRIAHLAVASRNTITQAPGSGVTGASLEMQTTSEGRMDVNVDRGIVLHTETQSTIDGSSHITGGQVAMPPMRMHGTTKMSADLTK